MKSFFILLTVLVQAVWQNNTSLAQSEDSSKTQIQQLEARLSGTQGLERFDILLKLTKHAARDRNHSRVLMFGEEAQKILLSFDDPERELILVRTLLNTYAGQRDLDLAFAAARRLSEVASELDDQENVAFSFLKVGDLHRYRSEHAESLVAYAEAERLYRSLGKHMSLGRVLNNSALVHDDLGHPAEQLRLYIQARQAFEIADHLGGVSLTSINIGAIYLDLGQYEEAEASYRQALIVAVEIGHISYEAFSLRNLGRLALRQGDTQGALVLIQQSLDILKTRDAFKTRLVGAFDIMGDAWTSLGDDTKALEYYRQALELATELEDWSGEINAQLGISKIYRRGGELNTAIELLERVVELAQEKQLLRDLIMIFHNLHESYAEAGRYREAYTTLQKNEALSSKILGEESRQALAKLQASFEAAEREKEIELLEKDQSLQQAKLARQYDNQRTMVAAFVLFLLFLALLFNWYRSRTQAAAMALAVEQEKAVSKGLREVDKLKDEFLANTSHALRTPL